MTSIVPTNVFHALPWQEAPWRDKSPILVLAGSAGSGKSRLAAEKVHAFLLKYPGSTGLMMRKTRSSMSNSTVLFFERQVLRGTPNVKHRPGLYRFEYPNGSILAYGGMSDDSQREHIRSIGQDGGLDICWIEEATQFTEEDFNEVLARMRGKAADWTQIILTTNPESPYHWIYINLILESQKEENSKIAYYSPSSYDNPYNSEDYIQNSLETLTGVQRERLLHGRWVQSSGLVYDEWIDKIDSSGQIGDSNVTYEADYIPGAGPVFWWVDDGISGEIKNGAFTANSHPRVVLFIQKRDDGKIAVFDEDYQISLAHSVHIRRLIDISDREGYPLPQKIVRDRAAASLGAEFEQFGFKVVYNTLRIEDSIMEVEQWVRKNAAGVRRLIVHPRCKHLRNEMVSYGRNPKTGQPIKAFDHGPDALRYGIWEEVFGLPSDVDVYSYDTVELPDFSKMRPELSRGIDIAVY